ncbi:MAG: MMPL family transporter [Candidatus Thiodiazotropha lotti]|nr:MMPL family transporter [Candidatus Thiodiazotropha lotti]
MLLAAVSVAAVSQLQSLQIHISPQGMNLENSSMKQFYEKTVDTFGTDNITQIYIQDPDLFEYQRLQAIRETVNRLQTLPFVEKTESLFSMPYLRVIDETVYTDAYLEQIPGSSQQAEKIREQALLNPFIRSNLLSDDGTAMVINLHLKHRDMQPGFDTDAAVAIETSLKPLAENVDEVFQIGLPYIRLLVHDQILQDQKMLLPMALLILLLTLILVLRRTNAAMIPLLTASLSIVWTLGGMAAFNIPVNVMTAIVPVILIIIGSTEDIHLISEYQKGVRKGLGRQLAIQFMFKRMGLAVFLTFLTSSLGFLSVGANPIQLLREFGLVASTGLAFNFFITATLVPVYLKFFGEQKQAAGKRNQHHTAERIIGFVSQVVLQRKSLILVFTFSTLAIAAFGSLSVKVNNNILDYFDDASPVKYRTAVLHEKLSGIETFSIVVNGALENTFQKVKYLQELSKIQNYLDNSHDFDSSLSITDYLSLVNSTVNESGLPELPEDDAVIAELANFSNHKNIQSFVSQDFSQARIIVRHNLCSSFKLNQALDNLRTFIRENTDSALSIDITGESVLTALAADHMAGGQTKSLLLMLVVIFTVISILFNNVKAGLLATLPNLFPIIILFGVMGYFDIPLDTATTMITAIALGICVDNTMHFMVRYNQALKQHKKQSTAIYVTMREEAAPITAASVSLSLGLGMLFFSSFTPVAYFGLLSGMVIMLAYFANFFITPLLLSSTQLVTQWDLLPRNFRHVLIHDCPLFKGMHRRQIKQSIHASQLYNYRSGEIISSPEDDKNNIFILLQGHAEFMGMSANNSLSAGQVFGLNEMTNGHNKVSTVVAHTDTSVLLLSWDSFQKKMHLVPAVASQILGNFFYLLEKDSNLNTIKKTGRAQTQFAPAHLPPLCQEQHCQPESTLTQLFEQEHLQATS